MKFKVGDKVKVKRNLCKIEDKICKWSPGITEQMVELEDKRVIIQRVDSNGAIKLVDIPFIWTDWMLEKINTCIDIE